jgi:hypothetical protein
VEIPLATLLSLNNFHGFLEGALAASAPMTALDGTGSRYTT